ncbi:kinase-like domain-containing protein [Mortierella sp. GBAus27b]|nr:kinase-like domain-containing protein [Mortierella sp. GBAus27b]
MDPPATPSHREFLKPQGPARPRGQASSSSAHAESSSTQSSAPGSPSSSAVDEIQGSASNYERQDPNADFVYYKKPPITPFEMDPSQPTQLLPDIEGLELSEGNGPFACLHGHGATMDADLIRDKTRYIVGTSEACDIRISHGSWLGLGLNPRVMNEPWFKLYAEPSISVPGEMKVYIEDISTTGVYVNGKKMAKSERILLQYGDVIKGGLDGSGLELFHYSFKKCINNSDAVRVIRGDLSTYRREEESFGQGNYAKVYKAIDEADQTLYACKAFDRHSRVYNDHEMAGIEFEITLLRDLRHENIVMFRDSCQIGAVTYLILEYVDGVTLFKYYTKVNNYFAEHEARTIFRQACNGVNYLHTQGIVHRDIKCENIMVVKTPDDKIKVKLIDFGLARRSTTERVLTTFCGTDPYMAPETAVGEESNGYGKAVDVWGLGVVLFRMLTGEYPFQPRRSEQVGNATAGKTQVESTLVEETAADPGASRQDPEITYSAGYRAFYKDDWRPRLNKLAPRSTEVKLLLDEMLEIDASKRCLIHRVFRFDWMRMATRELAKFDLSKESRKAADQETTESSHISLETSETSQPTTPRKTWGVLTIVPGSIADAPRRIELWKDKTKLGRDPRRTFNDMEETCDTNVCSTFHTSTLPLLPPFHLPPSTFHLPRSTPSFVTHCKPFWQWCK